MEVIIAGIMDLVNASTHQVNSTNLRDAIAGIIIFRGEGEKLDTGDLQLSTSWINKLWMENGALFPVVYLTKTKKQSKFNRNTAFGIKQQN